MSDEQVRAAAAAAREKYPHWKSDQATYREAFIDGASWQARITEERTSDHKAAMDAAVEEWLAGFNVTQIAPFVRRESFEAGWTKCASWQAAQPAQAVDGDLVKAMQAAFAQVCTERGYSSEGQSAKAHMDALDAMTAAASACLDRVKHALWLRMSEQDLRVCYTVIDGLMQPKKTLIFTQRGFVRSLRRRLANDAPRVR
jgi:hypothetical protein